MLSACSLSLWTDLRVRIRLKVLCSGRPSMYKYTYFFHSDFSCASSFLVFKMASFPAVLLAASSDVIQVSEIPWFSDRRFGPW